MVQGGSRAKPNSSNARAYNLRSGAKATETSSVGNSSHHQTIPPAKRGTAFSVSHAYTSVLDTLNKRKPRVFMSSLTPAASLGKPNHSSTPAIEFPRTPGPLPRATNCSFPPTTRQVNPQLARRLSQRGSTSSTASNGVTIVERSVWIDLYTD